MEHLLSLYHRAYDALQAVVCMDELSFQLLDHCLAPVPMKAEQIARQDYDGAARRYEHKGTINLLAAFQPLAGRRITWECPTRRAWDFAYFCKHLADECYPQADCIHLVVDNLNTHHPSSFYRSFAPEEAFRLANRFVFHYTPKHAS